jgi:UrcA family protein
MRMTLIALAAVALGAAPAVANDLIVEYKDLNLSDAKDVKQLERRINSASRAYCGADKLATGSRMQEVGTAECVASARKLAREQLATIIERQSRKGG